MSPAGQRTLSVLYDAYVFLTFLLCLLLIFTVGVLLNTLDRVFGTRLLEPLIRLFEAVGGGGS